MVHVKYPLFVIIFKINFYYITYHRLYLISIYYMLLNKLKKKSVNCCSNIILFLYIRFFFFSKSSIRRSEINNYFICKILDQIMNNIR